MRVDFCFRFALVVAGFLLSSFCLSLGVSRFVISGGVVLRLYCDCSFIVVFYGMLLFAVGFILLPGVFRFVGFRLRLCWLGGWLNCWSLWVTVHYVVITVGWRHGGLYCGISPWVYSWGVFVADVFVWLVGLYVCSVAWLIYVLDLWVCLLGCL